MEFNCPYLLHYVKSVQMRSFIWSVVLRIQTEYGDLLSKSPYLARGIQENADQKNSVFDRFSRGAAVLQRTYQYA